MCGVEVKPVRLQRKGWIEPLEKCSACLEREYIERKEKEREEAIKKAKKKKIMENFNQCKLGKRFYKRDFGTFEVNDENKTAYKTAINYSKTFENRIKDGKGIIYSGRYGTGKTHLAAAILKKIIEQGYSGLFISTPTLISKFKQSWDKNNELKEHELINSMQEVDLLLLDDLGSENPKGWIRERLFTIINSRYEKMLPTVITTNCDLGEISEQLGGRIESRIYEMCKGVRLNGKDYRQKEFK
mgnify:CR=1 FL=1